MNYNDLADQIIKEESLELFQKIIEELEIQTGKTSLEIIRELDYIFGLYKVNPKGKLMEMIQAWIDGEWLNWDLEERALT